MTEEKQEKKSCNNCIHFYRHYGWTLLQFHPVNCGHCIKRNITKKDYGRFPFADGCEQWEPNEVRVKKQNKGIKSTLLAMAERIEHIANFFDNEEPPI